MKPLRSILTVLALSMCACPLRAEVVPILSDTVGAVKLGVTTISKTSGAAKTLAISPKSTAFIRFATGDTGILPSEVGAARLTIYFTSVTKPGSVSFHNITSAFTESFPERSKPAPAYDATFASVTAVKGQFITLDVTAQVLTWLATPNSGGFGIAITADGTTATVLASKEGAGSGHPAVLEIDLASSAVASAVDLTNAATSTNTAGTIMRRDGSGNVTVGTITGNLAGNATNVTGIVDIANGGTGSSTQNFVDLSTGQSIGGTKNFTGNIGIGRPIPATALDVNGTITATAFSGNGSGLTGVVATSATVATTVSRSPQQIALLKWGVSTVNNTFAVGPFPIGICFDGASIWVANLSGNNVTKLNASTGAIQGTFAAGTEPYAICFDGASIWVANSGSNNVTKLNASTGAVQGTFAVGSRPRGICFDGASIWVANDFSNNVTKLNASTGAVQGTFAVGTGPAAICFDGASIWVANQISNNVTKLNASTGAVQGTFAGGATPNGICFDGASIWVANSTGDDVTKL